MRSYLEKLPENLKKAIRLSSGIAAKDGSSVYLIGGFVRDMLLGKPNFDLDLAVSPDAINFAGDLSRAVNGHLVCHKRFRTATVRSKELGLKIDIATLRKETYPEPAALPVVSAGTLHDDLARRDFTINAMAVSLNRNEFGGLVDLFGGRRDLAGRKIRILHRRSFIDDPTRIFRAVRFEQRYRFSLEKETLECLREAVEKGMIGCVQPERLRDELVLLFNEPEPAKYAVRLDSLVGLDFLSKGLCIDKRIAGLLESVGKEVSWFDRVYPRHRRLDAWLVYLMAVLDPLTSARLERVLERFRFHRGEALRLRSAKSSLKPRSLLRLKDKSLPAPVLFSILEPLSYEVIIFLKAKYQDAGFQTNVERFFQSIHGTKPQVSGEDLKGLGIMPGPHYQKIFSRLLDAKLRGKISSREEELQLVLRMLPVHRRK